MTTQPLTQDVLSIGLKRADAAGRALFAYWVQRLNEEMEKRALDHVWYQPDASRNWQYRYFWMFHYESEARDFITRLNFVSASAITVQISHFGARKPEAVEFVPNGLFSRLVYPTKAPPEVRLETREDVDLYAPLFAEHYQGIVEHLDRGGKLAARGWSHLEVALKGFLNAKDSSRWIGWYRPVFLGRREIDIVNTEEEIGIEVQGSHWHKREGMAERDAAKKEDILGAGWKLIWAWENAIRDRHGFSAVLDALETVRQGAHFVEID
jgi:very-short-patch-repair endonuclease